MSIITSERSFGVEMEMGVGEYKNIQKLRKFLDSLATPKSGTTRRSTWRFDDDGSIRHVVKNPIEVVSPILKGKDGEGVLRRVCDKLKEFSFDASHLACGFHVHLGGSEFKPREATLVLTKEQFNDFVKNSPKDILTVWRVDPRAITAIYGRGSNRTKVYGSLGDRLYSGIFGGRMDTRANSPYNVYAHQEMFKVGTNIFNGGFVGVIKKEERSKINKHYAELKKIAEKEYKSFRDKDDIKAFAIYNKLDTLTEENSLALKKRTECKDEKFVVRAVDNSGTEKLITLFLFYLIFDRVFLGMLPRSRRDGNAYCMPISETFTANEVRKCKTQQDFESIWYKDKDVRRIQRYKGEHYNDSRYHDVNVHSLFNRHGTIEIRSHGSTIDANKILLWTALHQLVVDSVVAGLIKRNHLSDLTGTEDVKVLANRMLSQLRPPVYLSKYVARMLNHYSGVTI